MQSIPILEYQNFNISFKNKGKKLTHAIRNLNLEIHSNSITGIIGESGSGKSITFLSLMRLLPSYAMLEGSILWGQNKLDLLSLSDKELRKMALTEIAYVFQDPLSALNPSFKIKNQLLECIKEKTSTKDKLKQIKIILEELIPENVERILDSYPHQLSGGQRQRVMIAMALINKPQLIVADEPTTALDPSVQHTVLNLLKEQTKKLMSSMVLISHDIKAVADYCDFIAVFYNGEMVEYGTANQILNFPKHLYTQALIQCRPSTKNLGYWLPKVSDFLNHKTTKVLEKITNSPKIEGELVELNRVSKKYKSNFVALNNLNITVYKGECLGVIGESGSGKSTLAKILAGLEISDSGSIQKAKELSARGIQMIFQDPYSSLNPSLSAFDSVFEIVSLYFSNLSNSQKQEKTIEILETCGINSEFVNQKPAQFSGGQRQRVSIARALASNPQLLICDEAVSALDISVQAQILNLLKQLQLEFSLTILFITHDMVVARYLCDRIAVLRNGNLIEVNSTNNIFNTPKNDYTKELITHLIN